MPLFDTRLCEADLEWAPLPSFAFMRPPRRFNECSSPGDGRADGKRAICQRHTLGRSQAIAVPAAEDKATGDDFFSHRSRISRLTCGNANR